MRNFRERGDSRGERFGDRSRGSRFGGRSGGSGFGGYGDRGSGRRSVEMHDTVCDKCGKECQVPFRPTEGKPVYCSECFEKNGGSQSRGRSSQSGMSSDQFKKINAKLDKIMHALKIESSKEEDESDDESEEKSEEE